MSRHEHACNSHSERRPRTALIDAFGERLSLLPGDGAVHAEARQCDRADQGRPADAAHRGLALHRPAPAADDGAGRMTGRQWPSRLRRLSQARPRSALLNGVSSAKLPDVDGARRSGASADMLADGSVLAGTRRAQGSDDADRRAEHRLRGRRLFPRHCRGRGACRPGRGAEHAGRRPERMSACRCASATGAKATIVERQTGSAAMRWSARSAISRSATAPN